MRIRADFNSAHEQRGAATVEMAIGLPVLLLLLLATAEFGRMLSQYDTLTKAVRDGARYAASVSAVGSTGLASVTTPIQLAVQNLVVTGNVNGSGSPILPGLTASDVQVWVVNSTYVEVSASYTYEPMLGNALSTFGIGGSIPLDPTLTATNVMRAL